MAKKSIPRASAISAKALRDQFDRRHNHCDNCGSAFGYSDLLHTERETAPGSFHYILCRPCCVKIRKMNALAENRATIAAMIRHAARYSTKFAEFVAEWYGVRMPRRLPGVVA